MQYLNKLLTLFKNINSDDQLKWAPQARGPLCFAHAAQSIATPLATWRTPQMGRGSPLKILIVKIKNLA